MADEQSKNDVQELTGPQINTERRTLTEDEFCRAVGISRVHCWRLRRAGKVAHCKVGTRTLYLPRHIDEFLNSCERKIEKGRNR
jgi:hypothetical protein